MTTIKRTIEIDADVDAALTRAAEAGDRSPSQIIESALVNFLHDAAETAEDARRWENYLKTGKAIPIDAMKAWVESWDTGNELPIPKP
jgi:predicted transcriptional regulator